MEIVNQITQLLLLLLSIRAEHRILYVLLFIWNKNLITISIIIIIIIINIIILSFETFRCMYFK